MISFNLPDPREEEKIRRGADESVAEKGGHGRYVKKAYVRQEYPKIMDKTPYPQLADFKGKQDAEILLEHARKRWDERQMASIVKNKDEEAKWLAEHSSDPVLTPGAYPKTMDRTPAPSISDCNGLEDYRLKPQEWPQHIQTHNLHSRAAEPICVRQH